MICMTTSSSGSSQSGLHQVPASTCPRRPGIHLQQHRRSPGNIQRFDLRSSTYTPGPPGRRVCATDWTRSSTNSRSPRCTPRSSTGPPTVVDTVLANHAEAVLREAVSNAVRHANATSLAINVSVEDDVRVEVVDDVASPAITESGLRNLRQQADDAGGTTVENMPTGGTLLRGLHRCADGLMGCVPTRKEREMSAATAKYGNNSLASTDQRNPTRR